MNYISKYKFETPTLPSGEYYDINNVMKMWYAVDVMIPIYVCIELP